MRFRIALQDLLAPAETGDYGDDVLRDAGIHCEEGHRPVQQQVGCFFTSQDAQPATIDCIHINAIENAFIFSFGAGSQDVAIHSMEYVHWKFAATNA